MTRCGRPFFPERRCFVWLCTRLASRYIRDRTEKPCIFSRLCAREGAALAKTFPISIANRAGFCYNRRTNKKCGGLRVLQHPQACTGEHTTYTTASTVSAWDIIRYLPPVCKGAFAVFIPASSFVWWDHVFTLCGFARMAFFVCVPAPGPGQFSCSGGI